MANFSITNSTGVTYGTSPQPLTTTYRTIILAGNGSSNSGSAFSGATAASPYNPRRGKIYDILIGQPSAPADTYIQWDVMRCTNVSTNIFVGALTSASSLFSLDNADGTAYSAMIANSSAEVSTFNADMWTVAINQRASYRWVAAPGSELVWPAVSSNGLGLRALGAGSYTGFVGATVLFQEQ